MAEEEKSYTLEENFERLERTLQTLGEEDLPLEEAFRAYSAGMEILRQCNGQIDRVEKQVLKLSEDGELEEFPYGE